MAGCPGLRSVRSMKWRRELSGEKDRTTRRCPFQAVILAALLCATPITAAFAQTTINAGDVSALPGTTAAVPIRIVLPAGTACATLQFNLTVVAGNSAPAVDAQVGFTSEVGTPTLNIADGLATALVGWLSNFSPLLTGTVQLGTLGFPIPTSAQTGQNYSVQVIKPSGTTDGETNLPMSGVNGLITIGSGPPPSQTGTPASLSSATPTAVVPSFTPTTALPSATATEQSATATSTAVPGGPTPTVSPSAAATATGTAVPTVTAAIAAASAGDRVLTLESAPSDFPSSGTITVIGNEPLSAPIPFARSGNSLNLLNAGGLPSDVQNGTTITVVPAGPEATATPTTVAPTGVTPTAIAPTTPAGGASAGGGGGGCDIDVTDRNATWMLVGLVLGVLMARRTHR